MPKRFLLDIRTPETGEWINWGAYPRRLFERQPDGSYVCAGHGSTVWIRCIAHHDGWFEHVDGGGHGEVHAYRLAPIPSEPGD
jgi:hypothetical protein